MISARDDLLKVSKDIIEHLQEVGQDISKHVIPPQGQATMADLARDAAEKMGRLVRELEGAPEEAFEMIEEPARKGKEEKDAERDSGGKVLRKAEAEQGSRERGEDLSGQHGTKPEDGKATKGHGR